MADKFTVIGALDTVLTGCVRDDDQGLHIGTHEIELLERARRSLRGWVETIEEFEGDCETWEHTDTGEVWNIFTELLNDLREPV